jgi:hypothetical protein
MRRRMQGRITSDGLVGVVAALIIAGSIGTIGYAIATGDDGGDGGDDGGDGGDDYEAVCTDHNGIRVDDSKCDGAPLNYTNDDTISADPFLWYYLGTMNNGGYAAAIGQRVSGGGYRTPVIVRTTGGGSSGPNQQAVAGKTPAISRGGSVPSTGGSVSRGGFGIKSGGASTGGSGGSGGGAKGGSAGS